MSWISNSIRLFEFYHNIIQFNTDFTEDKSLDLKTMRLTFDYLRWVDSFWELLLTVHQTQYWLVIIGNIFKYIWLFKSFYFVLFILCYFFLLFWCLAILQSPYIIPDYSKSKKTRAHVLILFHFFVLQAEWYMQNCSVYVCGP